MRFLGMNHVTSGSSRRPHAAGRAATLAAGIALLLTPVASLAAVPPNLVTNGTFVVTGGSTSFQFGTYGPYTPTESLAGWASTGYNYVFIPGSTSATGYYGALSLWSSASSGSPNTFNNASPTGGNFVAADADYPGGGTAAITQTINGLVVGRTYAVSFAWAGAQQSGFSGATTDAWQVTLGSQTQTTQTVNVVSQGFSGWMNQTFNYVATSTSEVLSFLAVGAPAIPPFTLLANVSVTQVPEPTSLTVLTTALAGLLLLARQRRRPCGATRGPD